MYCIRKLTVELILATAAFTLGYIFAGMGMYIFSGISMLAFATAAVIYSFRKSGKLTDPAAYFSLSWIGGTGVSALKLSKLQFDWTLQSWLSFYLAYVCFILAYELIKYFKYKNNMAGTEGNNTHDTCSDAKAHDAKNGAKAYGVKNYAKAYDTNGDAKTCDVNSDGKAYAESTKVSNNKKHLVLLSAINIVCALSLMALVIEAVLLGYIPLFTEDTPHAYSYFHISGLHYFTVSCVLVPSLIILYVKKYKALLTSNVVKADIAIVLVISLIIPILLVSRFQMLFSIILAVLTYLNANGGRIGFKINRRAMFCIFAGFIIVLSAYLFITYERAHSIEYLNGIFEMKNEKMPIFFTQPYIYIANNFDNFNMLTINLSEYTGGLKMLFPVFALTGMKFIYPELVSFPLYVTKEELTTLTLIYDAYYDFGIVGVAVFMIVVGAAVSLIETACDRSCFGLKKHLTKSDDTDEKDAVLVFIYSQLCFYLLFSFFTTWFSNPTTWFYIIASAAIGIYIKICNRLFDTKIFGRNPH